MSELEQIWAPWRMEYILQPHEGGCILCQKPRENNDGANFILYRGKSNLIMLNAFPYNPGHLMVAPYRHIAKLEDMTDAESKEHLDLIKLGINILNESSKPAGFNIGMNLGRVSGAGIADHIHSHIVPRWQGDTNFMPVVAKTKVLPQALSESYSILKESLQRVL